MKWENLTKIAVVGNRKFREKDLVTMYLHQYIRKHHESTEEVVIITNGDIGIGDAVELWAQRNGIKHLVVSGRWLQLELPAGPRRNTHIVDLADQMFAFTSKQQDTAGGIDLTQDALTKAQKKGIVTEVYTAKSLRRKLDISTVPKVHIPEHVKGIHIGGKGKKKNRDSIASLMEDIGGIDELKKMIKPKKSKSRYTDDEDFVEKNGRFDD